MRRWFALKAKAVACILAAGMMFAMPGVENLVYAIETEGDEEEIAIDEEHFPDKGLRDGLSKCYDADGNGKLSKAERDMVTSLVYNDVTTALDGTQYSWSIRGWDGIEYFPKLQKLIMSSSSTGPASGSYFESPVDVSKNTELVELHVATSLTTLDLSKNTALKRLTVSGSNLTTLDLSKNTALVHLAIENTNLATLDVTKNTALIDLNVSHANLTTLDLTKNTALDTLWVGDNESALDLYFSFKENGTRELSLKKDDVGGFAVLSDINGGTISDNIWTINPGETKLTCTYSVDGNRGGTITVTLPGTSTPDTPQPEEPTPEAPTTTEPSEEKAQWILDNTGWWYRHSDGSYTVIILYGHTYQSSYITINS